MSTIENVLQGNSNITKISKQLFEVVKVPLITGIKKFENPNNFGYYKSIGGQPLGVLGGDFKPQQPIKLFESFTRCLIDNTDADLSKVKYHEMKEGRKIRFSVPVKNISFTNMRGIADESIISLNIQTGFDGSTATSLYLSMYRLICSNGMKANVTEFKSKFKNTAGNLGKIDLLCDDVTKAINSSDSLTSIIERMNSVEITTKRKNEFIKNVLGYNIKDKSELTARKLNILEKIESDIAIEFASAGSTVWGLLNGITRYTNHSVKSDNSQVDTYIYAETGEKLNNKAYETAFSMVN